MDKMFEPLNGKETKQNKSWKSNKDSGDPITPIPDNVKLHIPKHSLGKPAHVWEYLDVDGLLMMRICRFVDSNGNKEDRPLTYRKYPDGSCKWVWKGLEKPRPLYGLDRLALHPDKLVIVCEGEKATDAATERFPDHVAVTSPNGANSPQCANWNSLKGRDVIIWPDHDDAGIQYAQSVAKLAKDAEAVSASIVQIPDDFEEKWDLADNMPEGLTKDNLEKLLREAELIIDW